MLVRLEGHGGERFGGIVWGCLGWSARSRTAAVRYLNRAQNGQTWPQSGPKMLLRFAFDPQMDPT